MATLAEAFWSLLTNPSVAYGLLILGLWSGMVAVSVPGTGLPEGMAVVALALAAVGLAQLPVNFAGLGLIGLALILFVLEFQVMAQGALLLAGAAALFAGSVLLFRPEAGGQAAVSWVSALTATAASTAFFSFILFKGLAAQRKPPAQDPDQLVGHRGLAQTAVNGRGTVQVAGELWSARADAHIPAGSPIVVVARQGLRLKVVKAAGQAPIEAV